MVSPGPTVWRRYFGKRTRIRWMLWPFHGIFVSGPSLNDAFVLLDTAEKSAEVMIKVCSMGRAKADHQSP
ncbi:MAG: Rhamnulose-1-phosphate aldolase [Sodalis sp.]|nr:MAG: Rhamnulose-1-phosphate aldolase [Sodalis sp.]